MKTLEESLLDDELAQLERSLDAHGAGGKEDSQVGWFVAIVRCVVDSRVSCSSLSAVPQRSLRHASHCFGCIN